MNDIHCHACGGAINDPATVSYRWVSGAIVSARPTDLLCSCTPAIVYGPPTGYMSWPAFLSTTKAKA